MAIAGLPHPGSTSGRESSRPRRRRRWLVGAGIAGFLLLLVLGYFAREKWPFRYRNIKPLLEDTFGSQITITRHHLTYFPNPGFVAEDLVLRRKTARDVPPIGTVKRLVVQGNWIDVLLLRDRVQVFEMDGLHLLLPPRGTAASREDFPPGSANAFTGPDTAIQHFELRDSVLEIQRLHKGALIFPIKELHIEHLHKHQSMTYAVDMSNAIPSGNIRASGQFGPLNPNNIGATPVSGQFRFTSVNLHDVGNIRGMLSSYGRFHGQLDSLEAEAFTNTPDFAVDGGRPTPLAGAVRCRIDGLKGNVFYHWMEVRTGKTLVRATGQTAGAPKATDLDIQVQNGRAEDLLRPFLHREVPITGPVALHSHAYLAPAREGLGFFQRLQVDGRFEIPSEKVTDPFTEKSLSDFSLRAQGKKPPDSDKDDRNSSTTPDALSSVTGPAQIRNAVVTTHGLLFTVAGAQAQLDGTFNLHTCAVHLTGNLSMQSDISHTTSGFKSFLLKPLAPFFHKKNAGAVVPIVVTGTPGKYRVMQNISHDK